MPKKIFKKFATQSSALKQSRLLGPLGHRIHNPNLWHLNRHSVSRAFFAALFTSITLMVFPCHMITAAFLAVWLRANLPVSLSLVWLVNPFTIPPLAYSALKIGLWVMPSTHSLDIKKIMHFDWEGNGSITDKIKTFWHLFERVWEPFMLGSLTLGLLIGASSYLLIQLFWRWHVIRNWNARQKKRIQQQSL
jgi:uncharacterized protein (DUF2062 family)